MSAPSFHLPRGERGSGVWTPPHFQNVLDLRRRSRRGRVLGRVGYALAWSLALVAPVASGAGLPLLSIIVLGLALVAVAAGAVLSLHAERDETQADRILNRIGTGVPW